MAILPSFVGVDGPYHRATGWGQFPTFFSGTSSQRVGSKERSRVRKRKDFSWQPSLWTAVRKLGLETAKAAFSYFHGTLEKWTAFLMAWVLHHLPIDCPLLIFLLSFYNYIYIYFFIFMKGLYSLVISCTCITYFYNIHTKLFRACVRSVHHGICIPRPCSFRFGSRISYLLSLCRWVLLLATNIVFQCSNVGAV